MLKNFDKYEKQRTPKKDLMLFIFENIITKDGPFEYRLVREIFIL